MTRKEEGFGFLAASCSSKWRDEPEWDGYFFDPTRPNAPFFYHMAEVGHYLWFPSFKNFLAAAIESYDSKVFKPSADGSDVEEDYDLSGKILERYGRLRVEE